MKVFETFFEFCEIISILLKGMVYMMEKIKIGSHVGMAGKEMFLASVKEAESYGANVLMLYTGAPQNTKRKAIEELRIEEAQALMIALYIAMDSFGTACNVTGDGAIAVVIEKLMGKKV